MRRVGRDLQRVLVAPGVEAEDVGHDDRVVDVVLGDSAGDVDGRRRRALDDDLRQLVIVADRGDREGLAAGPAEAVVVLGQADADRRVVQGRDEEGDAVARAGAEDRALVAPAFFGQKRQEGPRRELLRSERVGKARDREVRLPVFLLVHEGVVEPVDVEVAQLAVIRVGAAVVVASAADLVEVLGNDGARRHDDVHHVVLDEIHDHLPHPGRDERAGEPEEDRRPLPVPQHRLEDGGRLSESARLEGGLAVRVEDLRHGRAAADFYRRRRLAEERLLAFAVDADRGFVRVLAGADGAGVSFRTHVLRPPERMR